MIVRHRRLLLVPLLAACLCRPCKGEEPLAEPLLAEPLLAEPLLAEPLQALRERSRQAYDAGDPDGGHQALVELLAALPGRIEPAVELLGVMHEASMLDGRADRWTDYAAERLVALHQAGLLDEGHTAVLLRAYENLILSLWDRGWTMEAKDAAQARLELIHSAESVTMSAKQETDATRRFEAVCRILLRKTPVLPQNQRTPERRTHALRQQDLDPVWDGIGMRAVADAVSREWSELIAKRPDEDPVFFDQRIRTSCGADQQWLASDAHGGIDLWLAIDLYLQTLDETTLAPLRQLQETQYKKDIRPLTPTGNETLGQMNRYRASPWSATANAELLALALVDLNRGRTASALRSFLDVKFHAAAPAVRQSAQVGVWLAAASVSTASELDSFFEGVNPNARFPWMGKTETAATIKTRLKRGMTADARENVPLAELDLHALRLPAEPTWPGSALHGATLVDLQVRGNRILAGSRNWLAWYDVANTSTPLWLTIDSARSPERNPSMPGYWRPAIVNNRLYTRAGNDTVPSLVRALDVDTGQTIWETEASLLNLAAKPRGKKKVSNVNVNANTILADPIVAGGCVYYIDLAGGKGDASQNRLEAVCVDADDGSLIWRATVKAMNTLSTWENAPVLSGGALYLNNAGIAARLDPRDGRVEWITACRGRSAPEQMALERDDALGASPLVLGDRVLLMARQGGSLFAVHSHTGKRLWEQALVQPLEMLGAWKDCVIVRTANELVGTAIDTGEVRWHTPIPRWTVGRCTLIGNVIHLASADALLSIDAENGAVRERRTWPTDMSVWNVALADKRLFAVTDETAPTAEYNPDTPIAPDGPPEAAPLRLPLADAWFLPRENARIFTPPPHSPLYGRLFMVTDGMLEAVDIGPRGRVAWRVFTEGTVSQILFEKTTLALCSGAQITMGIDGQTGRTLWRLPRFRDVREAMQTDGVLLMRNSADEVRAYDAATGKPLWSRNGFRSVLTDRPALTAFAQNGLFHLFGHKWKGGVPNLRIDARTGVMLPLRWAVDRDGALLGQRSVVAMGKQSALIRVWDTSTPSHQGRVFRYFLADGKIQDLEGMDMIYSVHPPYVLAGRGNERTLLSCDDSSIEYSLKGQGDPQFDAGLVMFVAQNSISVVDPVTKRKIVELDIGKKQVGSPGFVKSDDNRLLFYGTTEEFMTFREIDIPSGRVIREDSRPRAGSGSAKAERLQGRALMVNNILIFSSPSGLQALMAGER